MEFLKNIALPQPIEHFHLLLFILNVLLMVFLPYFGFLFGTGMMSVFHHRRAVLRKDALELRYARDLLRVGMYSKNLVAFLGVLPALGLVFVLAQFLQRTPAIAPGLMAFGFLFFFVASVLLYAFRYNLDLEAVLSRGMPASSDLRELQDSNRVSLTRTGRWGSLFLFLASVFTVGAISITVNRGAWERITDIFDLLIDADFWVGYLQFLAVSLGATGVGILVFFFEWEGGAVIQDERYVDYVRPRAIRMAAVSLLAQPVLLLASIALLPAASLTGGVFGLAGAGLACLLLTGIFLFAYRRDNRRSYLPYAFYSLTLAFFLLYTKDQVAISNATQDHAANLAVVAERDLDALKAEVGVAPPAASGESIYNGRCSACHLFDQKKVGPPYDSVIPKFAGHKDALIRFILNPVKIDPAYPNMPNQGLKPAEADSIATYLMARVLGKPKQTGGK
jgi:cytochrome c